jgi:hypothetical protein
MPRKSRFSVLAVVFSVLSVSTIALAGKPERDKQKELEPKVAELKKDIKTRCGCDIKVTVDWSTYKTARDMSRIEAALSSLSEATQGHCASEAEKKILCSHLKGYTVGYAEEAGEPKLVGGSTIWCGSTDVRFCGGRLVKEIIDTFN